MSSDACNAPRIAVVGAFPFPYPQGSQVYARDLTLALMDEGARATFFTYHTGSGAPDERLHVRPRERFVPADPSRLRSGPSLGKPFADLAVLTDYARTARREGFDFALAHNAEAACIALAARPLCGVPVIYVAHTLLRVELDAYVPRALRGSERTLVARALAGLGACIDALVARRSDGVIALSQRGLDALRTLTRKPIALIPPGLAPVPPPSAAAQAARCAELGLEPGGFVLYSGNLDGYQDLHLLAQAAQTLPPGGPPIVLATHDATCSEARIGAALARGTLRCVEMPDAESMRELCHAAGVLVLTRRRIGGFPIKLLNYMEAGRPILAFRGVADGLRDGDSARLLELSDDDARCAGEIADALVALFEDPGRCARLGAGARAHLLDAHDPARLAREVLDYAAARLAPRANRAEPQSISR